MMSQNELAGAERKSNIELLRIIAGFAVVILHFNYFPGGIGAVDSTDGITRTVLLLLEGLCICAVNIFVLISGYFSVSKTKVKTGRIVEILLQTIVISFCYTLITSAVSGEWSIKTLAGSLIPTNYYVILYCALMLLSPFVNFLMNGLDHKKLKLFTGLSFILFSVFTIAVDLLKEGTGNSFSGLSPIGLEGSMNGYTIVNFALVYIIGAYLKKTEGEKEYRTGILLLVLAGITAILFFWQKKFSSSALAYCNPLVIMEAVIVFLLFRKLKIQNKWINFIAPASFSCFLIHGYLLRIFDFGTLREKSLPFVLLMLVLVVLAVYAVSILVMLLWKAITKYVFRDKLMKLPQIGV